MRKLQEIDYDKIKKGLEHIDVAFAELNIENFSEKTKFEEYFNSYYNRI